MDTNCSRTSSKKGKSRNALHGDLEVAILDANDKAIKEAEERQKAVAEKDRADRETDAAWSNQYIAHMNLVQIDYDNLNLNRILDTLDRYRKPSPGRKDVRGWEWYYQVRLCSQELRNLKGHTGRAQCVAFSPDGARLASASADRTVKLWDPASGHELHSLKGQRSLVWSVAFNPDGKWLASAGTDGAVRLWDARPLRPDVKAEVEAVALLETLFSRPFPKSEVRAAIQRDKILSEPTRKKALKLAERFKKETDPEQYHAAAWPVIRHPYANVFVCQFAVAQMKAAYQLAPDQAIYRIALGVAQYRLGRFHKGEYQNALGTLTKCDQNQPATLAFLAMTLHRMGDNNQAQAKAAIYGLNRTGSRPQQLEEAWIVHALVREDGLTQVQAAELLGQHKSWVCRRLALLERLADEAKTELHLGLLAPSLARQLTRLPVGNQAALMAVMRWGPFLLLFGQPLARLSPFSHS